MSENTGRDSTPKPYSQETLDAMAELAKWFDLCADNVRANNHNQRPQWEGRAGGFEQAAYYTRIEIGMHSFDHPEGIR